MTSGCDLTKCNVVVVYISERERENIALVYIENVHSITARKPFVICDLSLTILILSMHYAHYDDEDGISPIDNIAIVYYIILCKAT
jgi:hypothetical protein